MNHSKLPYQSPQPEARWRALVSAFESSGLSMPAFCRREGVAESSLYAWRARLRGAKRPLKAVMPRPKGEFVALGVLDPERSQALAAPSASGSRAAAALEIKLDLGGGVVLHLRRG
jgi:putative transposase